MERGINKRGSKSQIKVLHLSNCFFSSQKSLTNNWIPFIVPDFLCKTLQSLHANNSTVKICSRLKFVASSTHIDWNESNYFLNNNVYKWVSFLLLHYNFVFVAKNLDEDNYNMSNNFFMNFFFCFILLFICHKIILFHKTKQKKTF